MDPKSTAKSKRSHTQHGRRTHQHHPPPSAKTPSAKAKEPPRPARPSLPSNWDRYSDEFEDRVGAVEDGSGGSVVRKSKGADFGGLIERAREGRGGFAASFDDSVPDFIQGLSPMLSVRGNSLLLQCQNDNFIVDDDDVPSTSEVPFLSMDLHALASQLAKVKPSRRLFLDPIYFPEEMDTNESIKQKTKLEEASNKHENAPDLSLQGGDVKKEQLSNDHSDSKTTKGNDMTQAKQKKCPSPVYTMQINTGNSDYLENGTVTDAQESMKPPIPQKTNNFQVSAAEAELDMLLRSLEETKLSNSPSARTSLPNGSTSERSRLDFPVQLSSTEVPTSSNDAVDIDSSVDDLLAEAKVVSFRIGVGPKKVSQDAQMMRYMAKGASLDDSIDSLLAETSSGFMDEKEVHQVEQGLPPVASSSSAASVPKALDDFDSWLDTI